MGGRGGLVKMRSSVGDIPRFIRRCVIPWKASPTPMKKISVASLHLDRGISCGVPRVPALGIRTRRSSPTDRRPIPRLRLSSSVDLLPRILPCPRPESEVSNDRRVPRRTSWPVMCFGMFTSMTPKPCLTDHSM